MLPRVIENEIENIFLCYTVAPCWRWESHFLRDDLVVEIYCWRPYIQRARLPRGHGKRQLSLFSGTNPKRGRAARAVAGI